MTLQNMVGQKNYYKLQVYCTNCNYGNSCDILNHQFPERIIKIEVGKKLLSTKCPKCGCKTLEKYEA